MRAGARSRFCSHSALPSNILGSSQAASAFGCSAKFVTLGSVCSCGASVRKPLEAAVRTSSGCCQCLGSRGLLPPGLCCSCHPQPLSAALPADTGCCGCGDGAAEAAGCVCDPSPLGSPATRCLVLEKAWALGGQSDLLMEAPLALCGWPAALPRAIHLL